MEFKKNPKVSLEEKKGTFFQIGLVITLAVVLFAFEYKSYDEVNTLGKLNLEEIEEEMIPITQQNQPPPPPPPPPPPVQEIIKIVEDDVEIEEEIEIDDSEADEDTEVEDLAPDEEIVEDEIFVIVEDMPSFPGCEKISAKDKRDLCTQQKIQEFMGRNQRYPEMAREAGIQGTVYVSFVVGKNGKVDEVTILKGVAGGKALDKEAKRLFSTLPKFTPGKQRGKPVKVKYTTRMKFTLN